MERTMSPMRPARHRRPAVVVILGLMVIGALVLSSALDLGGASASPGRGKRPLPRLTLTRLGPATVSGRGFRPHVHVRVGLTQGRSLSRDPLTNRTGSFTVSFPVVIDRCSGWSITASVRHQPEVVLRSPAQPECAPASAP